jgi:hypothetical protein
MGGAVGEKKGAASTMFASFGGRPLTEKYVTRGDPNFLMLKAYYTIKKLL